jgi:alanyl-tRNA synthetase
MADMTGRLYYHDSFLHEFEAKVTDVLEHEGGPAIVLDRTAFYPTSGGQLYDTGTLAPAADPGAAVRVAEVVEDEAGTVYHCLESPPAAPLAAGTTVRGKIDQARRRDHMQQHSGQHILSAAFVRLFQMPTVSFHMGAESCTIDLETKSLSAEQVEQAERLANQVVTDDRPVKVKFVNLVEARGLGVRKLPPQKSERALLRLLDILEFDLTACGGTHVRSTGQVGPILLRKTENVKQGVRVEFVCGARAVAIARRDFRTLTEAAGAYSAHIWELPQQVRKATEEGRAARKQEERLLEELAELHAERLLAQTPETGGARRVVQVFAEREAGFVKLVAQKLTSDRARPAVALLAAGAGQPTLIFAQTPGQPHNMGALLKESVTAAGGRGGGSQDLAQGGVAEASALAGILESATAALAGK